MSAYEPCLTYGSHAETRTLLQRSTPFNGPILCTSNQNSTIVKLKLKLKQNCEIYLSWPQGNGR